MYWVYFGYAASHSLIGDIMRYHKWIGRWLQAMTGTTDTQEKWQALQVQTGVETFLSLRHSARTKRAYRNDVGQFLTFAGFQQYSLFDLAQRTYSEMQQEILQYLKSLTKREDTGGHITNGNTLNRKRYTLVSFFRHLQDAHGFPYNPARKIPVFPRSEHSNTPVMTRAEILGVMRFLHSKIGEGERAFRDYLIVLGLFHFALRRQELAHLKWDMIHESPRWHFRLRQKGNRWKHLPIPPKYLEKLTVFARQYGKPSAYIFRPTRNNRTGILDKPISTNTVFWLVNKVNKIVLPNRRIIPHSFRASFVTLARENNIDHKSIMNATGHSSVGMVDFYDLRERLEANAINFFGDWMD